MAILQQVSVVLIASLVCYLVAAITSRKGTKGTKALPGPRGLPFLGNALDLAQDPHLIPTFNKWAKEYGPICSFQLLGKKQVVLSNEKIAADLLIKRGNIYSGRGTPPAVEYVSRGLVTAIIPKNDLWRRQRKLMHSVLSLSATAEYEVPMEIEALYTLRDLLQTSADFSNHLARYTHGVLSRVGLGKRVTSVNDPFVREHEKLSDDVTDAFRPDMYPCNLFPRLLTLPSWLVPSNGRLDAIFEDLMDSNRRLTSNLRTEIRQGKDVQSLHRFFLENEADFGLSDVEGGIVFQSLLMAGTRSPHNALLQYVICMMKYPEWQERLQEELDRVVGPSRLPTFSDMPKLPTLRAIIKEDIRYRSIVAEIGIPHMLDQDDFYEGYFFPAGTVFHANFSAMLSDPGMYPDGPVYNPARWLDSSYPTYKEPLTEYPNLKNFVAFGHGRRACPGSDFTERSLNIMVARMAWAMTVKKKRDSITNQEVDPEIRYEPTANPKPFPFPADIVPRSKARMELVLREADRCFEADKLATLE